VQFLIFVLVASAVGITVVLLRNRPRTGMDASIDEFRRGLRAVAPRDEMGESGSGDDRPDEWGARRSG
jgi:hypothetical protein